MRNTITPEMDRKIKQAVAKLGVRPAAARLKLPKSTVSDHSPKTQAASTGAASIPNALALAAKKLGAPDVSKLTINNLEKLIKEGVAHLIVLALSLWQINKESLYKALGIENFEQYCELRKIGRSQGYKLVALADVYLDVLMEATTTGQEDLTAYLTCETHARPLALLTSAAQRYAAVQKAVEARRPTGKCPTESDFRQAVYAIAPLLAPVPKASGKVNKKSKNEQSKVDKARDLASQILALLPNTHPAHKKQTAVLKLLTDKAQA